MKQVKIPSLATFQVAKYVGTVKYVHEPLKNRTFLEKKKNGF